MLKAGKESTEQPEVADIPSEFVGLPTSGPQRTCRVRRKAGQGGEPEVLGGLHMSLSCFRKSWKSNEFQRISVK